MLTRLKVKGFKNLVDVDVRFGPFTCFAGANGVGKSNLFDAIMFLSDLAAKPLMEAALSVRSEGGRSPNVRGLFTRAGDVYFDKMTFEAEILIPPEGVDDLGQEAKATTTFLRYVLVLAYRSSDANADAGALEIAKEELTYVKKHEAKSELAFPHSKAFRDSLRLRGRRAPFISTSPPSEGSAQIRVHNDWGGGETYPGGGKPRSFLAARLPRTILSTATAAESPTALLARREMQSWRMLQLEPSAMRSPDNYQGPSRVDSHGAHLPATLARLTRIHHGRIAGHGADAAVAVRARIAGRLSSLIEGVRDVRVDADDRRELLTLIVTDVDKTSHEARALSDGTLRFLALAILEQDPEAKGLLCLEEPENGIHPARIPSILSLLRDLAVDAEAPVGADNPLRQVIINTHSPAVVGYLHDDDLLVVIPEPSKIRRGSRVTRASFQHLDDTWRHVVEPDQRTVAKGQLIAYLNPLGQSDRREAGEGRATPSPVPSGGRARSRRVFERADLQLLLFSSGE